ncbi:MAG: ribose-phosphate pyrophosphokinase-like domain-containing protein, partial [Candidatus Micrarchaeota archaeon]|nr:ribose-phosphate pyrophosphokinase-like domain-containing protein [Candidatus Micrarchaeota archaeon]
MIILGGSASNGLDILLSKVIGADLTKIETTKFPDGEMKVKVPELNDENVVVVQSTYSPQEKNLFELLLTCHELSRRKA